MIEEQIANAITQEAQGIKIRIKEEKPLNRIRLLLRLKPKTEHQFVFKPIVLGNLIRISKILEEIDEVKENDINSGNDLLRLYHKYVSGHGEQIIDIVAIALTNTKKLPKESLKDLIRWNVDNIELLQLVRIISEQLSVQPFITTIISMKGMSLMKKEELIASGELSEIAPNTSDSV
jgi:hypothetical protein